MDRLSKAILKNVERQPDHPAFWDESGQFTYQELADYAFLVAGKLNRLGVKKGDYITIELPRTKEYIGVMLGAWFLGAVYAPLDSAYPMERRDFIAGDCNAVLRITEEFLCGLEKETPLAAASDSEPDDPSLLIYTSGSTGTPKGVLHSRRSIYNSAQRMFALYQVEPDDRHAMLAPLTFVASTQGAFGVLMAGISSFLVPDAARRDPVKLADFVAEHEISKIFISPKMLKLFRQKGNSLKLVVTGSERVSNLWSTEFKITNIYGSSESAGGVICFELDRAYDNTPIGKPVGDERLYLLDENGQEAEEGEICLAGFYALRYLGLPEKSAEVFTPNPFVGRDGQRDLLRTGDIGRRLPDGNILYVNRKDWMVKINGQRVEPGEIEAVLRDVPGVQDAAVKDFTNQYDQVYLCAYYTGEAVPEEDLRKALNEKLPPYMVPAFFTHLDKLPVNQNGKLDRKALPKPEKDASRKEYKAPETEEQKLVCAAMEQVLGMEHVGINDSFFRLGGDSIRAVVLADALRSCGITVADVYAQETPEKLAECFRDPASQNTLTHTEKAAGSEFPLTPAEQSMYLEQKIDPSSTEYNLNFGIFIYGADPGQVETALSRVFAAHDAFRSVYGDGSGKPVRILTDAIPEIVHKGIATRAEVEKAASLEGEPFDLCAGIPVRASLYELAEGGSALHLQIHHIGFDGGSVGTFVDELMRALKGQAPEAAVDLSDIAFIDRTAEYETGMQYYQMLFEGGVPQNEMPVKGSRPPEHPVSDSHLGICFPVDELSLAEAAAREQGITLFELLMSALSMTLGKYCVSEDVVMGVPTNLRDEGMNNMIGMFVNTAAVRLKPVRTMPVKEYCLEVRKALRRATRTAYLPFSEVVGKFSDSRDRSRCPIFDVSVNYLLNEKAVQDGDLRIELTAPVQNMKRDFGITMRRDREVMQFDLQYSSQLFDEVLVNRFVEQFRHTLAYLYNGGDGTVRDALALPKAHEELLRSYEVAGTADVPVKLLHKLFEKTAAEHAEETALIAADATLTYAELDRLANRAANGLIERGVCKGKNVLLLLPRKSWYFVAMFGVLKTGAAFVPCDPTYPEERINYILEDSDSAYIVTTADMIGKYPADKCVDILDLLAGTNDEAPEVEVSPEDLVYMIYTSGSTGRPKGVMIRHKGICNYLLPHPANVQYQVLAKECHTVLSVTTVSFDMSFKEHTGALCNGKTLVFASENESNDPRALTELFEMTCADCFNATPSRLQQYLQYKPFAKALARCKLIMCGGEGYPISLRNQLKQVTDSVIINTYGPTEITVSCNGANITNADHISVGRPLLNVKEWILDKYGDPAAPGIAGELYVGGMGVAVGYKNLPEQTESKFIEYQGERVFRTGDLSKWDEEGKVIIIGRLDSQVKIRGLRIELGEIQGLIDQQPDITKSVVVVRKINGQDNLAAYFTATRKIDIQELKKELEKKLTHYMTPTAYLQMFELPMTPNGKTNIKALPEPELLEDADYEAPANETEEFFCNVFARVIGIERVGATDDFFRIGGTSLTATSVIIEAEEGGYKLTYGDAFANPTPRALAALFEEKQAPEAVSESDRNIRDYDYSAIDELLAKNTVESFLAGECRELGDVLITGATGYMGSHLLAEYLRTETGTAYCMVRKGKVGSAEKHLKNFMVYYHGAEILDLFEGRIVVIDGNVTDPECFAKLEQYPIRTVFNCAANVKHFSSGTDIEDINIGGAVNCVNFCKKTGARLIHFSTISTAGILPATPENMTVVQTEQTLYFGQKLDNQYTSSKMIGEREVLAAAAEGYDMKVIRVGTLAARASDGEFQINFLSNSFMGRLRSYAVLGCFPYERMNMSLCMGPIDTSVEAFLKLAKTPQACCLFNAINSSELYLVNVIRIMNEIGISVDMVENSVFYEALQEAEKDPQKAMVLQSLLAYKGKADQTPKYMVKSSFEYTTQILGRMGFYWGMMSEEYVVQFLKALQSLGFFDLDQLHR